MHHDFIRHLSFNSEAPFTPARAAAEPMRCVLRSYNEVSLPAFPPSPRPALRSSRKARIQNRK